VFQLLKQPLLAAYDTFKGHSRIENTEQITARKRQNCHTVHAFPNLLVHSLLFRISMLDDLISASMAVCCGKVSVFVRISLLSFRFPLSLGLSTALRYKDLYVTREERQFHFFISSFSSIRYISLFPPLLTSEINGLD
jgi:hypothetical protein